MGNPSESTENVNLQKPSGTVDHLPEPMDKRRWLTRILEDHFQEYGFRQVDIPIYDFLTIYQIRSGEKIIDDIFSFLDPPKHRAEENPPRYALRPEFTASLVRAYISSEMMYRPKPQKYFYLGPCFRYDEPSPGRYRQFTQAGVEIFGADTAIADTEMVLVPIRLLEKVGIEDYILRLNDLTILRSFLTENKIPAQKESKIFGIIDNITGHLRKIEIGAEKDATKGDYINEFWEEMQKLDLSRSFIKELEPMLELVGKPDRVIEELENIFQKYPDTLDVLNQSKLVRVCELLEDLQLEKYVVDCGIARGLDYYTDIVFEIDIPALGREKQVCGGGRYNHLIEEFGGERTPACGFSFGFERIIIALEKINAIHPRTARADIYIGLKEDTRGYGLQIAEKLRQQGLRVEIDIMNRSFRSSAKLVNRLEIPFMMFIGPREKKSGKFTLKNFNTEEQHRELELNEVISMVKAKINPKLK